MAKYVAIVLAAGSGKRMGAKIAKQYLPLNDKPLVYYALRAFSDSKVDEIVLVVAPGEQEYCQREIVEKYHINKVTSIIEGGCERYDSVYEALKVIRADYVLIHDGARAFITDTIIEESMKQVEKYEACVVGVPVKDTIKVIDDEHNAASTPDRSKLWIVQTPQCFSYNLVRGAYDAIMERDHSSVTDDAMVVQEMTHHKVKLIQGSYENIKVTTPEDIVIGEAILNSRKSSK